MNLAAHALLRSSVTATKAAGRCPLELFQVECVDLYSDPASPEGSHGIFLNHRHRRIRRRSRCVALSRRCAAEYVSRPCFGGAAYRRPSKRIAGTFEFRRPASRKTCRRWRNDPSWPHLCGSAGSPYDRRRRAAAPVAWSQGKLRAAGHRPAVPQRGGALWHRRAGRDPVWQSERRHARLLEIKRRGGIAIAQAPDDAAYPDMPKSARARRARLLPAARGNAKLLIELVNGKDGKDPAMPISSFQPDSGQSPELTEARTFDGLDGHLPRMWRRAEKIRGRFNHQIRLSHRA
ncbi:hypothetical protein GA830_18755 (plasmid) [Mesorhizobium sp. NBSH29]|nr:hypothetical protein GA830_18755 [Mesorhizobium sp. NBSH29]